MTPVGLTPEQGVWIWTGIGSLIAVGLLLWGFVSLRRKRLIENVPTSKVKGVFMGLNEVKGIPHSDIPLTSYLAESSCVYYRYSIEEHYRYTETYTDSKGKTQTRTVSGWKTVHTGEEIMAFLLEDSTGRLRVDPRGAQIEPDRVFSESCGQFSGLYYDKGPRRSISNSTHRRRFTEHALELGSKIYVIGMARFNDDLGVPEVRHDDEAELFLISTRDEKQITRRYAFGAFFKLLFGTAFAFMIPIAGALGDTNTFGEAFAQRWPAGLVVAAVYGGIIAVYYLTLVYNGLVSVRERVEMATSMIDVQLRRRHILIPRLASCVKAAATHERETHVDVAEARLDAQTASLRRIFAVAEDYPDLKADSNFKRLQGELVSTEDRIALAREFHNGTVKAFNDRIATLPDSLVAALCRLKRMDYFAAAGFERTVPKV